MKERFTHCAKTISFLIFFLAGQQLVAQPDYDFRNPVLESGTGYDVGAVYRFSNVKPGVDALVTITNYSGGVTLFDLDGGSGFAEAFQPVILIPPGSNGFIDFDIQFVVGGTSSPMVQTEVPVTCIDVDGNTVSGGKVFEADQIDMGGGYINYDLLGGELQIQQFGTLVTGKNIAAIDYPGVDTTARQVMFTVYNNSISGFFYRTGGENTSTATQKRLRSVYFKKFWFNNAVLAASGLASFTGVSRESQVDLSIALAAHAGIQTVYVEKSTDGRNFSTAGTLQVYENSLAQGMKFSDEMSTASKKYYRLKLVSANGQVSYSNILVFNSGNQAVKGFKIYPNLVQDQATISLQSDKNMQASLYVVDMSGRMMRTETIRVQTGTNNISIQHLDQMVRGNYYMVLNTEGSRYVQPFIKR